MLTPNTTKKSKITSINSYITIPKPALSISPYKPLPINIGHLIEKGKMKMILILIILIIINYLDGKIINNNNNNTIEINTGIKSLLIFMF
jgi:hypothetical protein